MPWMTAAGICPQCGAQEMIMRVYDYGTCSETGYHDAGEEWQCLQCGSISDEREMEKANHE